MTRDEIARTATGAHNIQLQLVCNCFVAPAVESALLEHVARFITSVCTSIDARLSKLRRKWHILADEFLTADRMLLT
jgi:hypothetical protein